MLFSDAVTNSFRLSDFNSGNNKLSFNTNTMQKDDKDQILKPSEDVRY